MPIIQTNIWICEICGHISSKVNEVSSYDDPVVTPPNNEIWDYTGDFPNEKLTCPNCLQKQ